MYRFLAEVHDAILLRKNHDFGANPGKEKESSQPHRASRRLPAVLPPVGRCVASQGEGGVRIPSSLFGRVLGSFSVRRKRSRRKGRRRGHPRPGHFCPQCGQFGAFGQGLLREQKQPCWGRKRKLSRRFKKNSGVAHKIGGKLAWQTTRSSFHSG